MICLVCGKRKAVKIEPMGWMPCLVCQKHGREVSKPKTTVELTTDEIREGRKIYGDEILQSWRDGHISKEYIKKYPDRVKTMIKEGNVSIEEVNSATNVWDDLHYYKNE